jgi:hypothetical protein
MHLIDEFYEPLFIVLYISNLMLGLEICTDFNRYLEEKIFKYL